MNVLIDTREQKNWYIKDYLNKSDIEFSEMKLDYGDYTNADTYGCPDNIVVERKGGGLYELTRNMGIKFPQFEAEVARAQNAGAKLHMLIEEEYISNTEQARIWTPYYINQYPQAVTGKQICKRLRQLQRKYDNFDYEFVTPSLMPLRIVEILSTS